jgi:hypothetical protein
MWQGISIWVQTQNKGRMPDLRDLLSRGKKQRQTRDEQLAVLTMLSQQTGFPLKVKTS